MGNNRSSNKSSKKVLIIIIGVLVLIVAAAVGVFMSKGKPGEGNDNEEINGAAKASIEHKIEYGSNIKDERFVVNTKDGKEDAKVEDLDPKVNTMKVGKTDHKLEIEDEMFDVTVIVEDTQKPVIKGVKDVIELKGEKVNVEEELTKLITAEDPVDGDLEVFFDINKDEKDENNYSVTAEATDKNDNKVVEKFEVVVKQEEKEEIGDNKDNSSNTNKGNQSNNNTAVNNNNSNDKGNTKSNKPKPESKPKPKSKPEPESKPDESDGWVQQVFIPEDNPLAKPVSPVPGGASVIDSAVDYTRYSYNSALPGGGKITQVTVSTNMQGGVDVSIEGVDNSGNSYYASKSPGFNMGYDRFWGIPDFENDDYLEIDLAGDQFLKAYGY